MVVEKVAVKREMYLSIMLDRYDDAITVQYITIQYTLQYVTA